MNLLAIETSGAVGSVAACRDDAVLFEARFRKGMEHGKELVPMLKAACERAGWNPRRDVELVAVSHGPGSYTGLRVGVTCAKTLAYAAGCKVVPVPSPDVLAENAHAHAQQVCPVVDARRGQVYAAVYRRADEGLRRETDFLVISPADLVRRLDDGAFLIGNGISAYAEAFAEKRVVLAPEELWQARASAVARLGLRAFLAGRVADPARLEPLYLRRPEPEERLLAREAGRK